MGSEEWSWNDKIKRYSTHNSKDRWRDSVRWEYCYSFKLKIQEHNSKNITETEEFSFNDNSGTVLTQTLKEGDISREQNDKIKIINTRSKVDQKSKDIWKKKRAEEKYLRCQNKKVMRKNTSVVLGSLLGHLW